MFSKLFSRWSKSTAFSQEELRVLRELLPSGNSNSELLYAQAVRSPYVERKLLGDDRYEATIPYVVDSSMTVDYDQNVKSPILNVTDDTGKVLQFTTEIIRGGFLRGLEGKTADGQPWPKQWKSDFQFAKSSGDVEAWVPKVLSDDARLDAIRRLLDWSGLSESLLPKEQLLLLRITAPATERDIAACEDRIGGKLCDQYKELVRISNGFGIRRGRPYEILGTHDLEYLDDERCWIGVTPLYEDGYVALRVVENSVSEVCCHITLEGNQHEIGDLRKHVQDSLRWD